MEFRLDRFSTLHLVSPLLRLAPGREPSVPILMYHSISDEIETNVRAYYRTKTSPAIFALQMKYLHDTGYKTCSPAQAIQQLQTSTSGKDVVITFDDGYRDFYQRAFPVLSQYGFGATVYLPTAYIGDSPAKFKGTNCLTWSEVRELKEHGILFGSHTVNHPRLVDMSHSAVNYEITVSKQTVEQKLGCAIDSFAYPYAFPQAETDFTKMLRDALRQAGYQNGVCTIVGMANRNSEPLFLERLPVNSCDDASLFAAKLAGAYNWVGTSQYISKMVKAGVRGVLGSAKPSVSKDFPLVQ